MTDGYTMYKKCCEENDDLTERLKRIQGYFETKHSEEDVATIEQVLKELEENKKLEKSRDDFAEASSKYYTELQELKSQLSAVEALEWFKRTETCVLKDVFHQYYFDVHGVFEKYTPQEIVDKIQEYEKNKNKCKCDDCNKEHCEEDNGSGMCYEPKELQLKDNTHFIIKKEDMKKYLSPEESAKLVELLDKVEAHTGHKEYYICNTDEPYADKVLQTILDGEKDSQFKVGDWVKYKGDKIKGLLKILQIINRCPHSYAEAETESGKIEYPSLESLEHAEPPKEELKSKCKYRVGDSCILKAVDSIPKGWECNCIHFEESPKEEAQVEWVWECECRYIDEQGCDCGCFHNASSEQEAKEWCEENSMNGKQSQASYRKVCRRKE